ncbi:MAG: M48 family metallopeptidase [Nitrospirota bacterium]
MHPYLYVILIAYLSVTGFRYLLDYLNLSYLKKHGSIIPPEFEGQIDRELLIRTQNYSIERIRFGFVSSLFNHAVILIFLFGGLLDIYNSLISSLNLPFILSGLVFFLILIYAESLLSIPFSLYNTFKIEKKYGFNTMTPGLWITDGIKSLIISTILMGVLIVIGFYLVQQSPGLWWLWIWCFFLAFSIFMMYISPYVIEPLFHKFTPIVDENLESGIRDLMQKAGIRVSRVFQMDASKRTKHTNAYFTGIGKVKRIVLFDTLIEKMDRDEILSVLAHEAGHWKRMHILKQLFLIEGISLVVMYIAFRIIQGDYLLDLFAIKNGTFFAKLVILSFIGSIAAFPFSPLLPYLSRRYENEADRFSYELTHSTDGMIRALVKLSKDNLSNLHPHPLYVVFHYSHPPVLERIRSIEGLLVGK